MSEERREREIKAAMEQIRSRQKKGRFRFRLDIPVWKLAIEGVIVFLLAFLVGLGFAVMYEILVQ